MKKSNETKKNPDKFGKSNIKTIISENNKLTQAISILALFFIMFGLFAFIIIGLYRYDLIVIPRFIQNIFFNSDGGESENEKDDRNIYDFIRENAKTDADDFYEGYTLEITQDIIANVKLPDNLNIETEAKYYNPDGKVLRTEEMTLWKKGDKYKYILSLNSIPEESYTNDTKNELIENFITGNKQISAASDMFSFNNIPHIQNINYYLDLLESGEIINCVLKQNIESNVVRIKYSNPQLNQRELIDISLDTGIVLYVECTVGNDNDLFYRLTTTIKSAYYDGDEQSEQTMPIPDSMFEIK